MTTRRIAKGIKGIKSILAADLKGWQVFLGDGEECRYDTYYAETLDEVRDRFKDRELYAVQGNNLFFRTVIG